MAKCDQNGKRRRIVPAPVPSQPRLLSAVLDVECAEDEEVVWHYTTTLEGRFVSGYSIVLRVSADETARLKRLPKSQQRMLLQMLDGMPSQTGR